MRMRFICIRCPLHFFDLRELVYHCWIMHRMKPKEVI